MRVLAVLLLSACAGQMRAPEDAFNAYRAAYARGDAATMWDLTTPAAQQKTRILKAQLLKSLNSSDPVERVSVKGRFGITAADIAPLNEREFFVWVVKTIRHRLGAAYVGKMVAAMRPVRMETVQGGVALIYRDAKGVESRMLMQRVGNAWRVNEVPFPVGSDD